GVVEPGVISAAAHNNHVGFSRACHVRSGRFEVVRVHVVAFNNGGDFYIRAFAESATDCATSPQIDVEVTIFRVSEPLLPSDPSLDASSEDAVEQADAKPSAPMLSAAKATRRPRLVRES